MQGKNCDGRSKLLGLKEGFKRACGADDIENVRKSLRVFAVAHYRLYAYLEELKR